MEQKKGSESHTVMPKKLAEALMEAGMQHFDVGGSVGAPTGFLGQFMGYNQYQAHEPGIGTQGFMPQIQGQQQNQRDFLVQQQSLANQLINQVNGAGPSVARNQLNQSTGQNAAMQGALMASQRGASANPALMARQSAMQGANIQQQGAGQAATLRAQEQLGSEGQAAQMQQAMGNQALQAENIQQGGLAAQNSALVQSQLGTQNINANISGQNAKQSGNIFGGLMNSIGGGMAGGGGAAGGMLAGLFNKGGTIPHMADGGMANYQTPGMALPPLEPYQNFASTAIKGFGPGAKEPDKTPSAAIGDAGLGGGGIRGGQYLSADVRLAQGGPVSFQQMLAGGNVPGQAQSHGDSKKNDTVPTMLSPGEIVLPRSVTEGPNMEKKAIEFLRHLKGKGQGFGDVAEARKMNKGGRVC